MASRRSSSSASRRLAAFRAAREAFTNVAKRGVQPSGALVLLTWATRSLGLPVAESGGGGGGADLVSGSYGLTSTERGATYGGQREAGQSQDGLTVRLGLPIDLDPRAGRLCCPLPSGQFACWWRTTRG
jgi:signal transduction histidine kinase